MPACQSAEGGQWGGSVSAIPASAGKQNRKIFVSLIEKKFGGRRLKKCRENFSVLLAVAKRRRTETLGGIQSAKSSGFCSKKVRISSNKHHHNIFNGASCGDASLTCPSVVISTSQEANDLFAMRLNAGGFCLAPPTFAERKLPSVALSISEEDNFLFPMR